MLEHALKSAGGLIKEDARLHPRFLIQHIQCGGLGFAFLTSSQVLLDVRDHTVRAAALE